MKKLIILLLITTGLFAQSESGGYYIPSKWKLSGSAIEPVNNFNIKFATSITIRPICDGVTDNLLLIQNAVNTYRTVHIVGDTTACLISAPISIPSNTALILDPNTVIKIKDSLIVAGNNTSGQALLLVNSDTTNGNTNIYIEGGIWDGNNPNQYWTGAGAGNSSTGCFTGVGFRFLNVTGLTIKDLTLKDPVTFGMQLGKLSNFLIENITLDYIAQGQPGYHYNQDGIHLNGQSSDGTIKNIIGDAGDGHVAINADDSAPANMSPGAISNILIDGIHATYMGYEALRILSSTSAISNVIVRNITGRYQYEIITAGPFGLGGTSDISGLKLENISAQTQGTNTTYALTIDGNIKDMSISGWYVKPSAGRHFLISGTISLLNFEGMLFRSPTASQLALAMLNESASSSFIGGNPYWTANVNGVPSTRALSTTTEGGTALDFLNSSGTSIGTFKWANSMSGISLNSYESYASSAFRMTDASTALANGGLFLKDVNAIKWSSTSNWYGAADLILDRDAANTLAQKNGVSNQLFRLYDEDNTGSNDRYLEFGWLTDSSAAFRQAISGTKTSRPLNFTTFSSYSFDAPITNTSNLSTSDSLITRSEVSTLADSLGVITLATGVAGWGEVMAGDNQEWAHFRFTSAGVVTLIDSSANVTTTINSIDKLNIYDAGSGIAIQNNLGASKKVAIKINYYQP